MSRCIITFVLVMLSLQAHAKVVDKIVAIVNDQIITLSDLRKFRQQLSTGGLVDDALIKLNDPQTLLKDNKALLNHLIDEKLIDSEVKRKNMEVTIERVEQEIRNIARNNDLSRQQLQAALRAKGVTISQYQDFIKTSLERQSLIEREVTSKIRISDEDITSYYFAKQGPSTSQVYEYDLSHILIAIKDGDEQGARNRAKNIEERLANGEPFEALAERFSEDPRFANGGQLGIFKSGEMLKEIEDAVRKINPGQTTPPIKTQLGFQIIKVNKRTLLTDSKLDNEEKERIRRILYAQEFKRQFRLWLKQRREEAFLKINGF